MASLYGRYSLPATLKLAFISAFTLLLLFQGYSRNSKEEDSYSSDYLFATGEEDSLEDDFEFFSLFPTKISFTWETASHHFILPELFFIILTSHLYRLHCVYRL